MKLIFRTSMIFCFGLLFSACAANITYTELTGKPKVMLSEENGKVEVTDGIDIWVSGNPNRSYIVLGEVVDKRKADIISRNMVKSSIAKQVIAKGGDAAILDSSVTRIVGTPQKVMTWHTLPSGAGYATYATATNTKRETKYQIIKYLDNY